MQDTEIWKPIPEFIGYEASTHGRIRSIDRVISHKRWGSYKRLGKLLTAHESKCGYYRVGLQINKIKNLSVHRLVAITFLPNPLNKRTVNHIDGDKSNNRLTNLEWSTHKENIDHSYQTGLKIPTRGIQFKRSKLDELQVMVIKSLNGELSDSVIAKYFNVNRITINDIFNGRTWKHI